MMNVKLGLGKIIKLGDSQSSFAKVWCLWRSIFSWNAKRFKAFTVSIVICFHVLILSLNSFVKTENWKVLGSLRIIDLVYPIFILNKVNGVVLKRVEAMLADLLYWVMQLTQFLQHFRIVCLELKRCFPFIHGNLPYFGPYPWAEWFKLYQTLYRLIRLNCVT